MQKNNFFTNNGLSELLSLSQSQIKSEKKTEFLHDFIKQYNNINILNGNNNDQTDEESFFDELAKINISIAFKLLPLLEEKHHDIKKVITKKYYNDWLKEQLILKWKTKNSTKGKYLFGSLSLTGLILGCSMGICELLIFLGNSLSAVLIAPFAKTIAYTYAPSIFGIIGLYSLALCLICLIPLTVIAIHDYTKTSIDDQIEILKNINQESLKNSDTISISNHSIYIPLLNSNISFTKKELIPEGLEAFFLKGDAPTDESMAKIIDRKPTLQYMQASTKTDQEITTSTQKTEPIAKTAQP